MKPSSDAARIYAVLALRAAGRPVERRAVAEICEFLRLPDDPQGLMALMHLLETEREETPADLAPVKTSPGSAARTEAQPVARTQRVPDAAAPEMGEPAAETGRPLRTSRAAGSVARWDVGLEVEPLDSPPELEEAFYVYGVVEGRSPEDGSLVGIEGARVEVIPLYDMAVLGHPCPAVPYSAADEEIVIGWIEAHDAVLRQALAMYAAVVPCKFNTMIKAGDRTPTTAVIDWLDERKDEMRALFSRVRGRNEYGLRVLWDPGTALEMAEPPPLQGASDGQDGVPPGVQYLLQEQQKRLTAANRLQAWADLHSRCLAAIVPLTEELLEEHRDGPEQDATVLRCACLVPREMSPRFLDGLKRLQTSEHVHIQVTGPWPAYSFVADRSEGASAP